MCQWTDSKSKFLIDGFHLMSRRPCLCTKQWMFVYKKLFSHAKTFFYSKQFAKLLTTWLKTIFWESFSWRAFHSCSILQAVTMTIKWREPLTYPRKSNEPCICCRFVTKCEEDMVGLFRLFATVSVFEQRRGFICSRYWS